MKWELNENAIETQQHLEMSWGLVIPINNVEMRVEPELGKFVDEMVENRCPIEDTLDPLYEAKEELLVVADDAYDRIETEIKCKVGGRKFYRNALAENNKEFPETQSQLEKSNQAQKGLAENKILKTYMRSSQSNPNRSKNSLTDINMPNSDAIGRGTKLLPIVYQNPVDGSRTQFNSVLVTRDEEVRALVWFGMPQALTCI